MAKKITYQQAYDELNIIVEELQNNMVTIDIITQKLERAKALVEICYQTLKGTEEKLSESIKHLESLK